MIFYFYSFIRTLVVLLFNQLSFFGLFIRSHLFFVLSFLLLLVVSIIVYQIHLINGTVFALTQRMLVMEQETALIKDNLTLIVSLFDSKKAAVPVSLLSSEFKDVLFCVAVGIIIFGGGGCLLYMAFLNSRPDFPSGGGGDNSSSSSVSSVNDGDFFLSKTDNSSQTNIEPVSSEMNVNIASNTVDTSSNLFNSNKRPDCCSVETMTDLSQGGLFTIQNFCESNSRVGYILRALNPDLYRTLLRKSVNGTAHENLLDAMVGLSVLSLDTKTFYLMQTDNIGLLTEIVKNINIV